MEPKVYTYQKKYTLANGEVKYCKSERSYIPKNKPGERTRKKKEGSIYEITQIAKELDTANREVVAKYIRELYEKQRINSTNAQNTEGINQRDCQTV
jgi:hypothetical protein